MNIRPTEDILDSLSLMPVATADSLFEFSGIRFILEDGKLTGIEL